MGFTILRQRTLRASAFNFLTKFLCLNYKKTTLTQARTVQKRGFENGDGLSLAKATFALLLTHSNTNNQQLITRLYPKRTAHFTRLAAALLPLPKLKTFWNPTFYPSFSHVYFECGAWVFRSIFRRIVSSRTHHLSSKFASKSNPLFHSFDGKSKTTKNVIGLALPDSFHPSLCSVCLLKQQEVILLLQLNYMI